MDLSILLPGSSTPCKVSVSEFTTARQLVINVCKKFSIAMQESLNLVLAPTSVTTGSIIEDDVQISSLNLTEQDVLQLWKGPYLARVALAQGPEGLISSLKEVALDYLSPLSHMIPTLKKAFDFQKEFSIQYASLLRSEEAHKKVGTKGNMQLEHVKYKWLSTSESLSNQGVKPEGYLIVFPMKLFRKHPGIVGYTVKRGWLTKQALRGERSGRILRRWFVLADNFMFFFRKETDSMPRGVIALEYHTVKMVHDDEIRKVGSTLLLRRVVEGFKLRKQIDCIRIKADTDAELKDWLTFIQARCINSNSKRVFGVDLAEVANKQRTADSGPIPSVIWKAVSYLDGNALTAEGLFRLSGQSSLIEYYRDQFDQGTDVNLEGCRDPHVVACLLKLYLRELPEPLLTWRLFDRAIATHAPEVPAEQRPQRLVDLLLELPEVNYAVLKFLFAFLARVKAFEEENRMGSTNLGLIFGPVILRSLSDSGSESGTSMFEYIRFANAVAATLIDHQAFIFQSADKHRPPPNASKPALPPVSAVTRALRKVASAPTSPAASPPQPKPSNSLEPEQTGAKYPNRAPPSRPPRPQVSRPASTESLERENVDIPPSSGDGSAAAAPGSTIPRRPPRPQRAMELPLPDGGADAGKLPPNSVPSQTPAKQQPNSAAELEKMSKEELIALLIEERNVRVALEARVATLSAKLGELQAKYPSQ